MGKMLERLRSGTPEQMHRPIRHAVLIAMLRWAKVLTKRLERVFPCAHSKTIKATSKMLRAVANEFEVRLLERA